MDLEIEIHVMKVSIEEEVEVVLVFHNVGISALGHPMVLIDLLIMT